MCVCECVCVSVCEYVCVLQGGFSAGAEHLVLHFVPLLRQISHTHSRLNFRQGWCIHSTSNCTQPLSTGAELDTAKNGGRKVITTE